MFLLHNIKQPEPFGSEGTRTQDQPDSSPTPRQDLQANSLQGMVHIRRAEMLSEPRQELQGGRSRQAEYYRAFLLKLSSTSLTGKTFSLHFPSFNCSFQEKH